MGDIDSWTFVSWNIDTLLKKIVPKHPPSLHISDYSGFKNIMVEAYTVEENYLQTLSLQYYLPREIEQGLGIGDLPNGDPDPIQALYSDVGIAPNKDGSLDPEKVAKINFPN